MNRLIIGLWLLLLLGCRPGAHLSRVPAGQPPLDPARWQRSDLHDGYVIGNGRLYAIGGLGRELNRTGKSGLSGRPVSLSRLAWLIGPTYTIGNLAFGWELQPILNGDTLAWTAESIHRPASDHPHWGVDCENEALKAQVTDLVMPNDPVLLRQVVITRKKGSPVGEVKVHLPVFADPRNAYYAMFNGAEVDEEQVERWREACGPNLKPRPSVAKDRLIRIFPERQAIVTVGASRALWQEISTIVPDDSTFREMFPPRAMATAVSVEGSRGEVRLSPNGFLVELGRMAPGEQRRFSVWIVTSSSTNKIIENQALALLDQWRFREPALVMAGAGQALPPPFFRRTDGVEDTLLNTLNACTDLARTCQALNGGVMAQPYMYPMYYVRDQFGSFKLLLAQGDYQRALQILRFYVARQNYDGIQNAHDLFGGAPDPGHWRPGANSQDGHHRIAEVPSYIILMARYYFEATADIEALRPLYDRLAYNLRVQEPSSNGILPWPGDESYTNTRQTHPQYREEMTDSQLLFIGAAGFMADLAARLGHADDAAGFAARAGRAREALFRRMWLPGEGYFAFARDAGQDTAHIDRRPAFDALLRWFYLELGDPQETAAQSCLQTVLRELVEPIRVVPEFAWCAGMDPGYLLYATARSQDPAMHSAARLLTRYASASGLFAEYYTYQNDTIQVAGGTLRPWESSVNGFSIIGYLAGLQPDLPKRRINLQPHLPPGWPGWKSKQYPIFDGGWIQVELSRKNNRVKRILRCQGLRQPLTVVFDWGGFGGKLRPLSGSTPEPTPASEHLQETVVLKPSEKEQAHTFSFEIGKDVPRK